MTTQRSQRTQQSTPALSPEEQYVADFWLAWTPEGDADATKSGGRLLAHRGVIVYNPDPADRDRQVCIGSARSGRHQVYARRQADGYQAALAAYVASRSAA